MKIGVLQLNATVGDFAGNVEKAVNGYREACRQGAELVLAPEMFCTGYPPWDLLLRQDFVEANLQALDQIAAAVLNIPLCIGYVQPNPKRPGKPLHNAAAYIRNGRVLHRITKCLLPTYDVFDEDRYFEPCQQVEPISYLGRKIALTICEDIWNDSDFWNNERRYAFDPVRAHHAQGADLIVNLSASPWSLGKQQVRLAMLQRLAQDEKVPVVYANMVGGNDDLLFDGLSIAFNRSGQLVGRGRSFVEDVYVWEIDNAEPIELIDWPSPPQRLIQALTVGIRDYVLKCGFNSVIIGLSGGIDSAVTAALSVQALGAEHVMGVALPSRYSSKESVEDARALAENLGIRFDVLPIETAFAATLQVLSLGMGQRPEGLVEENLQPRLRAQLLMALAQERGALLLSTGNKSELATGYCTLYGDMAGALAPLGDVFKTDVYAIAHEFNAQHELIPKRSLSKAPSAELKPNQTDQDTLPPYAMLDDILRLFIEEEMPKDKIVARGFSAHVVEDVVRRVYTNEFKRRQTPPVLKTSTRAFGCGRQMPIAMHRGF